MREATMRLSDLCDLVSTQVDPKTRGHDVYVGLEHLASHRFERIGEGKASEVESSKYAFQPGDVLYGKLRPYLDKAVLASDTGICSTELLVLRPRKGVDPRFVVSVVHTPAFLEHAVAGTTGAQHPRTSWNHISEFVLPSFASDEATAIANLLWEVHHAIRANQATIEAGAELKRTGMSALFTHGLTGESTRLTETGAVPESWDVVLLEQCATVQTGAAKGRQLGNAELVDVPYLRVANVQDGHLDLREMKNITIRKSEIERYRLEDGDVVLTEGGDFDKLGRGFIWRGQIDLCVHQNHVFAVRTERTRLLPEFFAYQAQSHYGKAYFLKVAHKTTNLACINTTKLRAFPVLVPALDEQREISAILGAIDSKIDLHQRKGIVLEELFKALLRKLMTGEIRVADLDLSALEPKENGGVVA